MVFRKSHTFGLGFGRYLRMDVRQASPIFNADTPIDH